MTFMSDRSHYLNAEITQVFEQDINYPFGKFENGNQSVSIYLAHYVSFLYAVMKWKERSKRVDLSNI